MHFRIKKCDIFIDYAFILVLSLAAVFNSKQVIYLLLFSAFSESLGQLIADNRSETVTGRTVCPDTDNDDIVKRTVGF